MANFTAAQVQREIDSIEEMERAWAFQDVLEMLKDYAAMLPREPDKFDVYRALAETLARVQQYAMINGNEILDVTRDSDDHFVLIHDVRKAIADALGWEACECGCRKTGPGGMIEVIHPEDYKYDERA